MSFKIDVWNVGHGDTMRLRLSANVALVRDFGRSRFAQPTITSASVGQVANSPWIGIQRNEHAILSHAHEDHMNGFRHLFDSGARRIFKTSYIPWLDFRTADALGMRLTLLSTYLYAYSWPGRKPQRNAKAWLTAAPLMASLSRRLLGVSAGHNCSIGGHDFHFVWPPRGDTNAAAVNRTIAALRASLITVLDGEDLVRDERLVLVDRVAARISDVLSVFYLEDPPTGSDAAAAVARIEQLLESLGVETDASNTSPDKEVVSRMAYPWCIHKRSVDNHSIVFTVDNKSLFLSDLEDHCIDQMCRDHLPAMRSCRFLKSSHHGTRYGVELHTRITAPWVILHTCGPGHPSCYGPTAMYELLAPNRIICTDWNTRSKRWPSRPKSYSLFANPMQTFLVK